jgi:3',5'-cyclic AMP phosphodiesterase CpdA
MARERPHPTGENLPRLVATIVIGLLISACPAGARAAEDPVVLAAGDIADCGEEGRLLTARLLDEEAGTILAVGDLVYPTGTTKGFATCYAPSWGRFKERTYPVPGNHEYAVAGARPYYAWWGARAGSPRGYYSFDLGAWHLVALNSNLRGPEDAAQRDWLAEDLRRSPARCKLAFFHHTVFSSGYHGATAHLTALLRVLYAGRVSLALTGHDHHYERFAPLNVVGEVEPARGIRFFVVGTGGATLYPAIFDVPGSEARDAASWGVLKLALHDEDYDWTFLPAGKSAFHDAGHGSCVASAPP